MCRARRAARLAELRGASSRVSFVDPTRRGGHAGRVLFGLPQLTAMSCLVDGEVWTDTGIARHVDPARENPAANEGMRVLVSAALGHLHTRGFAARVGGDGWQITQAGREAYALRSER